MMQNYECDLTWEEIFRLNLERKEKPDSCPYKKSEPRRYCSDCTSGVYVIKPPKNNQEIIDALIIINASIKEVNDMFDDYFSKLEA